jgi:hypothetical protein
MKQRRRADNRVCPAAIRLNRGDSENGSLSRAIQPEAVMAGLVPAIQAAPLRTIFGFAVRGPAWMTGTRPVMTTVGYNPAHDRSGSPLFDSLAGISRRGRLAFRLQIESKPAPMGKM